MAPRRRKGAGRGPIGRRGSCPPRVNGARGGSSERPGALRPSVAPAEPRGQMPANVEIKARVRDLAQLTSHAERLSRSPGSVILQTDTFFPVPCGRLKLRDFQDGRGQLIFYDRPDMEGPKLSHYAISSTEDPAGLTAVLSQALGVRGVVKKERRLYMVGQTRVHVDRVEGLGDFMELEKACGNPRERALGSPGAFVCHSRSVRHQEHRWCWRSSRAPRMGSAWPSS